MLKPLSYMHGRWAIILHMVAMSVEIQNVNENRIIITRTQ